MLHSDKFNPFEQMYLSDFSSESSSEGRYVTKASGSNQTQTYTNLRPCWVWDIVAEVQLQCGQDPTDQRSESFNLNRVVCSNENEAGDSELGSTVQPNT